MILQGVPTRGIWANDGISFGNFSHDIRMDEACGSQKSAQIYYLVT